MTALVVGLLVAACWVAACWVAGRYREADARCERLIAEALTEPELAAGFDRLRAAIRDEQQKGEQT